MSYVHPEKSCIFISYNKRIRCPGWPRRFYTNTVHFTVHTHQKYRTIPYIFRTKIPYIPYIFLYLYRTHTKKFNLLKKKLCLREAAKINGRAIKRGGVKVRAIKKKLFNLFSPTFQRPLSSRGGWVWYGMALLNLKCILNYIFTYLYNICIFLHLTYL